jgi:hypothetical protein
LLRCINRCEAAKGRREDQADPFAVGATPMAKNEALHRNDGVMEYRVGRHHTDYSQLLICLKACGGERKGAIPMDDSSTTTATLDRVDEEILTCEVSDEALEAAVTGRHLLMTTGTESICWPGGCFNL